MLEVADLHSNYCNSEASSFQLTSQVQARQPSETAISVRHTIIDIRIPASKWRVNISLAATGTTTGRPRNINKSSSKAKVEDHAEHTEERDAA